MQHCFTKLISRPCSTDIVAILSLKIAPRRFSGDVLGIDVGNGSLASLVHVFAVGWVIIPVFAHGCAGIRKWSFDGIGMWGFAMPLGGPPCFRKVLKRIVRLEPGRLHLKGQQELLQPGGSRLPWWEVLWSTRVCSASPEEERHKSSTRLKLVEAVT